MKRVLVALGLVLAACRSVAEDPETTSSLPLDLEGAYLSDVDELELASDATYRYRPETCTDETCEETGTYTFDEASHAVKLTTNGQTYALPLSEEELETIEGEGDDESLKPANLVNGPSRLLSRRSRLLRGRLGARSYERQQGGCSTAQIQYAQSYCKQNCPGGSKGLNYCTPSYASCACKGGVKSQPADECRSAQLRYLRCSDRFFDCRDVFWGCNTIMRDAPQGCREPSNFCDRSGPVVR